MVKGRVALVVCAAQAAWIGGAVAQGASDPVIALDEISVAGSAPEGAVVARGYQPVRSSIVNGTETPILKIPQAVSVVTEQVIRDQQVRTLDEALYNVPGITQANTLGGTQDAVLRRGFGDNRDGSILRDGLRTALPRSFMPTTERVEVLKGPASALYGILDPGGLVNIVTKKPRFVPAGTVEAFGTSFNGGGASLDFTGPIEGTELAYRFVAEHRNAEYWRNFGTQNQQVLAPSLTWRGDTATVRLFYEFSHYRAPFDRGTIFYPGTHRAVPVPRGRRFDERYNITAGESHVAGFEVNQDLGETWKLDLNYAYSHNFYEDNQARVTAFNAATGRVTRRADATQDSNFGVHAARLDLTGRVEDPLGFSHELLFGASYDASRVLRTDMIRGPTNAGFSIFAPVYGTLPASRAVSAADSDQLERIETAAVYAQDTVAVTERLSLVGGLRYQDFTQQAGKGRPFNLNTDVSGGRVVPRVGAVYLLNPETSVYASYSETFRPNSSIASYIGALPPESGEAVEVGIKVQTEGITATAAFYDIVKSNVLYTETVNGISVSRTAGRVGSRGFEVDIAGQIAPDWSVIATYAYTDAVVLADPLLTGKRLTNVAPQTASLWVTHDFGIVGDGRLRAGAGARYVGYRPGDAVNSFKLPDYAVVDAFVAYDTVVAALPTTLQLNIRNLLDTTYYTSSIGTNNLGVEVGEPFQVLASARVSF
ncbi:TonB-dependent siderophore receptor [Methylobacterium nodulans]|uniref:TonB-dependent siderophore receptor n=1 Tax=Methylobacterium nodulans (strain LMG 21967 / CNCM I-2342 / ORS 2060) TaxID=460265 RepID=B8ISZ5_METNO|nr:TonB-dependent siderophore receptor [Methylobacterium nodulans]ACL55057.1 TonB-dependent siderophore receptor [Methylobacterium nodulans ORS 2060]